MANWESKTRKRQRFDETSKTIENLKTELILNDCILKLELDLRQFSDLERAWVGAELFKERLEALTYSSRSQIWRVRASHTSMQRYDRDIPLGCGYDYDESFAPKRMKYNHADSRNNNTQYQGLTINKNKKERNVSLKIPTKLNNTSITTKSTSTITSSTKTVLSRNVKLTNNKGIINTATKKITTATEALNRAFKVPTIQTNSSAKTTTMITKVRDCDVGKQGPSKESKVTKNKPKRNKNKRSTRINLSNQSSTDTTKPTIHNLTNKIVPKKYTDGLLLNSNIKPLLEINTNISCKTTTTNGPVSLQNKTKKNQYDIEQNGPCLFSRDLSHIQLQYGFGTQIMGPTVDLKSEPMDEDEMMIDDLADHI